MRTLPHYTAATLCLLLFGILSFHASSQARSKHDSQTDGNPGQGLRLELPASGLVRVANPHGETHLEVWDKTYVFAGIEESAPGQDGSTGSRAPIRIEKSSERLTIVADAGTGGSSPVILNIQVPHIAQVEIVSGEGGIVTHGVPRALSARTESGHINVQLQPGSNAAVTAETGGIIDATLEDQSPGQASAHLFKTLLGDGRNSLRLHSERGRITIGGASRQEPEAASGNHRRPPQLTGSGQNTAGSLSLSQTPGDKPQEIDPGDVIRVDTDLVTLGVSVIDRSSGRGLTGLQRSDFRLYEDGVEQHIAHFESSAAPFDLILLLDLSGSTETVTGLVRAAAMRFVAAARPQDRIGIVTFADTINLISPLTADHEALRASIAGIQPPKGSTRLYDAMAYCMQKLLKSADEKRRTALVVVSDGLDSTLPNVSGTGSTLPYKELLSSVQEFDGVVYSLWNNTEYEALSPEDVQPETFALGHDRMKELAEAGGGVFYEVQHYEDLAGTCERVVQDLGTIYQISYEPSNKARDGSWRTISIRVPGYPHAVARGKHGYRTRMEQAGALFH